MIKTKVVYPANQSNLKSIQKALIGWKKAGPPKKHFYFDHVNRLYVNLKCFTKHNRSKVNLLLT